MIINVLKSTTVFFAVLFPVTNLHACVSNHVQYVDKFYILSSLGQHNCAVDHCGLMSYSLATCVIIVTDLFTLPTPLSINNSCASFSSHLVDGIAFRAFST